MAAEESKEPVSRGPEVLKRLSDLLALITRDADASSAQAKLTYLEKEYLLDLQALKAEQKINIPLVPLPIFHR